MAGSLAEALAGVLLKPQDTGWGVGLTTLQAVAPKLMSPYASTGQNLGYGIGGALLAGLIGGMARRSADEQNQKLYAGARQLYSAKPEQRDLIVKENPKLTSLAAALAGVEQERAQELAQKQQELALQQAKEMTIERFRAGGDAALQKGYVFDPAKIEEDKLRTAENVKRDSALSLARSMVPIEVDRAERVGFATTKAEIDGKGYNPETRDLEDKVRDRFRNDPTAKSFQEVKRNFDSMLSAVQMNTKISDALATQAFIKIVDPGSVIRGSEVEYTNDSTRSRVESLLGDVKGLLSGTSTLRKEDKANLLQAASAAYNAAASNYQQLVDPELRVLKDRGGNLSSAPHMPYGQFNFDEWKKNFMGPVILPNPSPTPGGPSKIGIIDY